MSSSSILSLVTGLGLILDQKNPPVFGEMISRPGLSVRGQSLLVGDETLEIYEYSADTNLERDVRALNFQAQLWSKEGESTPYGFQKERMLVLYAGHHPQVIRWLTRVLGPHFLRP